MFLKRVEIIVVGLVTENNRMHAGNSLITSSERLQMFTIMIPNFKDRPWSNKLQERGNEVTWAEQHEDLAWNREWHGIF